MNACCTGCSAPSVGQPLDRGDFGAVLHDGQREAGVDPPAVDQHRAGAALAVVAALLRAGQRECSRRASSSVVRRAAHSPSSLSPRTSTVTGTLLESAPDFTRGAGLKRADLAPGHRMPQLPARVQVSPGRARHRQAAARDLQAPIGFRHVATYLGGRRCAVREDNSSLAWSPPEISAGPIASSRSTYPHRMRSTRRLTGPGRSKIETSLVTWPSKMIPGCGT